MNIKMNTDFSSLSNISLELWIILAAILFTQAFWLFQDASKRNANKWLWGIWGLLQAPTPFIVYVLFVRKIFSRNHKENRIKWLIGVLGVILVLMLLVIGIIFKTQ